MTGDLLGTLRYMSPEQIQAKHGLLDHRTDVYSLGLTLYELLTLRPAFPDNDRQKLLRQIPEEEPRLPRQLNKTIPKDLETIVLKAVAKEPQARYATAGEMADDLERFLEHKPIRARRPSPVERVTKWSRRHRWGVATALAVVFGASLGTSALIWHAQRREAKLRSRAEENLRIAMEAVNEIYLEFGEEIYLELDGDQLREKEPINPETEKFLRKAMKFYEQFARANRGEPSVQYETAKAYTRVGVIRERLGMHEEAEAACCRAIRIAEDLVSRSPNVADYRECLARAHFERGYVLAARGHLNQAIADYNEAIRLDPKRVPAYVNRGTAYVKKGELESALADYDKAIRLDPNDVIAHVCRGATYARKGEPAKAIADYDQAIRIAPDYAPAYNNRGNAFLWTGEFEKAVEDFSVAIRLNPNYASAYCNRGIAYHEQGELEKAIADCNAAIRLNPDFFLPYFNRANTYTKKGDLERAIGDYSEAIRLARRGAAVAESEGGIWMASESARLYFNRGVAYYAKGEFEKVVADFSEAIRLDPDCVPAYNALAWLLVTCPDSELRDADRAVELARKALELSPNTGVFWNTLGVAQYRAEDWKAAVKALEKSMDLRSGGGACDWLFLAMAHWQLGRQDEARRWYDKAVKWIEENKAANEELSRLRTEAETLIGGSGENDE